MENKECNGKRRKLLKTIAAGSGAIFAGGLLPESWTKPVVNSVVLPAHAQTSVPPTTLPPTTLPPTTLPPTTPPPTTTLTYSCSIEGALEIYVGPPGTQAPVDYTIENTGTGPLTGGYLDGATDAGTTGGIMNVTDNNPTIPDPFLPGATFVYTLNAGITTPNCPQQGGAGSIAFGFISNETRCDVVIDVTCGAPPA